MSARNGGGGIIWEPVRRDFPPTVRDAFGLPPSAVVTPGNDMVVRPVSSSSSRSEPRDRFLGVQSNRPVSSRRESGMVRLVDTRD
jgi:hypothetical protein